MPAVAGSAQALAAASGTITVHARTQIRDAVSDLLKQETEAWALVYKSRIDYPRDIWPYLKVYCDKEDMQRLTIHSPHAEERTLSLNIVGLIRIPSAGETETIEDKMDALALKVESILTEDALYVALPALRTLDLVGSAMDVILNQDDKISHAEITLTYKIGYTTMEGMPDTFA